MSITTIYRVSVDVPVAVWEKFRDTQEFERQVLEATAGSIEAGCNHYDEVEEWAEFHFLSEAQACERRLMDVMYHFAAKLLP